MFCLDFKLVLTSAHLRRLRLVVMFALKAEMHLQTIGITEETLRYQLNLNGFSVYAQVALMDNTIVLGTQTKAPDLKIVNNLDWGLPCNVLLYRSAATEVRIKS